MKLPFKNSMQVYCFIALLIVVPSFNNANAQGSLMIKLSPLACLDPNKPVLQAGLEYRFYKNLALEIDYGLQTKGLIFHWNDDKDQNEYYKLKTELKYYWPLRKNEMYCGLGVFYLPQSYNYSNGTFLKDGVVHTYQRAHVRRDVSVFCIKAGYVPLISKLFSIDIFAGIGLRYIYTEHTDIIGLDQQAVQSFSEGFNGNYEYYEGKNYRLSIETGVKLNILILRGR